MIIVKILGGLGNQMFQYAAGRSLAQKNNTKLYLDISSFSDYTLHNGFELNKVFEGEFIIASPEQIKEIENWRNDRISNILFNYNLNCKKFESRIVQEPHFHYWKNFDKIGDNIYIDGYWQSERYFYWIKSAIKEDYKFKSTLIDSNKELAEKISKSNSVSIHIRRGDYVNNNAANYVHGVCDIKYYIESIQEIKKKCKEPVFFIFSDDIDWVRKNLNINEEHYYVEGNKNNNSYIDMELMSLCKNNIIANSTFSWWAAWLNSNHEKVVIAPRNWFKAKNFKTIDLIPKNWIII